MNYSKIQRIISSFLLFIFFFGQIFGLSFFSLFSNYSYAENTDFHDLVSIIVTEKVFDKLNFEIERYAKDIQSYLDNTKVVILPVKNDTDPFSIASMNENLFYEGYKGLKPGVIFESKLVGTIIIGNVELPIVEDNGKITRSVVPFTDFEDKQFIYNPKTKLFEKNNENIDGLKQEIFHGIISPNSGNNNKNIQQIKDFLDKDHDFYTGKNLFDKNKEVLNGKIGEKINKNYKPYVFYFDGIREQKSLNYIKYKGYESYLNNKEDLIYKRYSQNLNNKIQENSTYGKNLEINKLLKGIDNPEILKAFKNTKNLDVSHNSDITLKYTIDSTTKKFLEIFNKGTISDFRTNVHNAGRYNEGSSKVNVDMIPYLVSILDVISDKVIKTANNDLEKQIDNLVKNSLSRNIAIPEKIINYNNVNEGYNNFTDDCSDEYLNFYNGKQVKDIKSAKDCSIFRGSTYNSGTLVEANRGYNIKNIEGDVKLCIGNNPKGYYGGASFLQNYDSEAIKIGKIMLKNYDTNLAIRNTFDILGSKKVTDISKNPSPLDCLSNNFLVSIERNNYGGGRNNSCITNYVLPIPDNNLISNNNYLNFDNWACNKYNKKYISSNNYVTDFKKQTSLLVKKKTFLLRNFTCGIGNITELDASKLVFKEYESNEYGENFVGNGCVKGNLLRSISYKKIPSYIEHKSPSIKEINKEIKLKITQNLPVDKDRYIDFISAKGNYEKINYPYLFRIFGKDEDDVKVKLDKYLKEKNIEINNLIDSENPDSLKSIDKEIYEVLKVGNYNTEDFDLIGFLKNKPLKDFNINGELKNISYYDSLIFSIYWNSLNNISAKYKFIMEYYLSDQVGGNDFKFILPKNKKEYEISYLGANGDAQNMYIKMNPEDKIDSNPYGGIYSRNGLLNSNKISVGVLNGTNKIDYNSGFEGDTPTVNYQEGLFKCAPPKGVPIRKWLPAVMCRLGGLLPVEVSIGEGNCGSNDVFQSDDIDYYQLLEDQTEIQKKSSLNGDSNINGLNDFCENKIKDNGSVKLTSDSSRYFFNKSGILKTEVLDKKGKRIMLDNSSHITFNLKKIVDKKTGKIIFNKIINNFDDKKQEIEKYIYFREFESKSRYGANKYSFSTKNKEADIYFEANLDLRDSINKSIKKITSNQIVIKIRNNRLFLSTKNISEDKKINLGREVISNDKTNIYIYDEKNKNINLENINKNSIVLGLLNIGNNQENKNINFPINIILRDKNNKIINKETINNLNKIKDLYSIKKSGSYTIEIEDKYNYKVKRSIEVLAGKPKDLKVDLGTTILENNGAISTNLVSIYDKFGNIVNGKLYNFQLTILGDSIEFNKNNSKEIKLFTYEGYKAFRIKSFIKSGISKIKIDLYDGKEKILSNSKNIKVINQLNINVSYNDLLKVGNHTYEADLKFVDKNNNIITDLNSRVYLSAGSEYIDLIKPYYNIVKGKSKIIFKTRTLSGENKIITFRIEGFNKTISKSVDILPEKPLGISFVNTKTKLEASSNIDNIINIELRDIYNNVIYTDNNSLIKLEILDKYKKIINSRNLEKKLHKGKVSFKISTTELPGKAYLKFSINKNLEKNKFIVGKNEKKLTIKGVSQNALMIDTYFFYNKKSIKDSKYNSLYTTLLGAEYGDITQKDYLAGSMLFDKNNRSLAVTSLLNSPYNKFDAIKISNDGIITKIYNKSDLTQDVTINLNKDLNNLYYLDLFNSALNLYIGKIYLNFDNLNIKDSIYNSISNGSKINLKKLLGISDFKIYSASNRIQLSSLIKNKTNSLIIYIEGSDYKLRDLYSKNNNIKLIYYIDPFNTEFSLNSFSRNSLDTYDNFQKNKKLGWGAGNKTLLSFSSGESVGNSTKQYLGVSGINLGDPIISLKKIQKKSYGITKKFDSTIGKKLNKNDILGYKIFDYNADNLDDILLIEGDGILSLLENTQTSKGFLDQKHLAKIIDIGKVDLINTGNFSGDKYDDIFFVNKKGEPFLLNNINKDFVRVDLKKNFGLKGKIIQAKSFDMDNDGIDDIVTLDDVGEINIFYGKVGTTNFTKKHVYSGYGMKLNNVLRNDLGAVYFDGLIQSIQNRTNPKDSTKYTNVDLLENLMFEKIPYDPEIDPAKENYTKNTTFIKSEFASQIGISVEKTYKDLNGGNLNVGDIVEIKVKIKNKLNKKINKIVYLESIPKYFSLNIDSIQTDKKTNIRGEIGSYDFFIDKFGLNAGKELILIYKVKTKVLSYGNIKVGLFEKGEVGDDNYGDILVSSSKYNCGGNSDIFRSTSVRSYLKGTKVEICDNSKLPKELEKNDIDENKNGIPDYIDNLTSEKNNISSLDKTSPIQKYAKTALEEYGINNEIKDEDNIYDNIDSINNKVDELSSDIDNLIDGFGCGFGGGNCFSMPINIAPLAPGNDLSTPFGLVGDGLKIDEGIPIMSSLTGLQTMCGDVPCCIPTIWPVSALAYVPGTTCGSPSAGGYLGIGSPMNFFRLFVTPTLTGGMGVAACFGGPAKVMGQIPPKAVTPFVPLGNCVIAAAPLPNLCEDEEINSDPSSIGQVDYYGELKIGNGSGFGGGNGNHGYGIINGNCGAGSNRKKLPVSNKIDTSLADSYLKYRKTGVMNGKLKSLVDSRFKNLGNNQINYNSSLLQNEPLISIGGGDINNSDISVSLDFSENGNGINFNGVQKLVQQRIAPFPRFITQWVNDQLEEFINKLVDFPTLFIILPDFSKVFNGDWKEYTNNLSGKSQNTIEDKIINSLYKKQTSGIKEAYEFLGNIPFVSVNSEIVNINIPQIDEATFNATFTQRSLALDSYALEIKEAGKNGYKHPENIIKATKFMNSLKTNLSILETYKDIPSAIAKLANKKQDYLEQILCNIETIENVTGGWLGRNGKRFKAWVELYILIKAILKSWQLLADIFIDYDAECHECKNERWDSTQWEWTLISMIVPPIPVIQFPKWPDIVLDLHNIRLNLAISLPEFKFNKRPIVLPPAPLLILPNFELNLPSLPLLPLLEIPKLPDIPSLPEVNLPDLPPPPTLPKLWSSIEAFLKILKIIAKMMCILKQVPLVPEHRVGDQIAFLTEGGGFRGFDFLDKLLPNFSYPYLDEIKVTSYVNLEFDADFIIEMAKTIVSPINDMTNDFTHMFDNKSFDNIDFSNYSKSVYKGEKVNSNEFLVSINKELNKDYIIKNPKFSELKKSFDVVNNYTYSKEDKLISNLKKSNYEKFDIIKSIIKRELKKNKKFKNDVTDVFNKKEYIKISNNNIDDIKIYNSSLKKYNDAFKQSAKNLITPSYFDIDSLKKTGENILNDVKNTTDNFEKLVQEKNKNTFSNNNLNSKKFLAQNNVNKKYLSIVSTDNSNNTSPKTCSAKKSKYSRNYEGLYVIQEKGNTKINYKLFAYLDDLTGDEVTTEIDFDLDGDADLLYSVNGDLYLKENLTNTKKDKIYLTGVEVLNSSDNKFINGDIYYEAVNGANESFVSNGFININFEASKREDISNYRLEYYSIIDKYLNISNPSYLPDNINKNIVDGFTNIEEITIKDSNPEYTIRKNLAYIYEVGNNISGIILKTKNLLNIKESLKNGNIAIIQENTQIYTGNSKAIISYKIGEGDKVMTKTISNNTNIDFNNSIKIVSITGNAYIFGNKDIIIKGNEIYNYLGLPILPETKIELSRNFNKTSSSHIGIKYFNNSEANLNFRKIDSYKVYDLGPKSSSYSITLNTPNDYLYSTIRMFKNNIFGTKTSQILLSPQLESDRYAPEIDFNAKIRLPVYQNKIIDLTDSIYENSGFENISTLSIIGLNKDKFKILRTNNKIRINFGKFDKIFTKNIIFTITDTNGNSATKNVVLEVYSPVPEITTFNNDNSIISGIINEELNGEPINIYRFRGGAIKRLETISGKTIVDTVNGIFKFKTNLIKSDLINISNNKNNIFNINENTGKVNLLNPLYKVVTKINDNNFVEVSVLNTNLEQVFTEVIKLKSSENEINVVDSFVGLKKNGLFIRLSNNDFDYYKIPDSAKFNPGSLAIYRKTDTKKEALFAIMPDSRIKILNNFYKIEYSTFNDYIVIKFIDRHFNKEIGQLLLRLDSSFVIQ